MTYTRFMDMHSGGKLKEKWQYIYIELPEGLAKGFFQEFFGHNPENITCTCCGEDYSISEDEALEQLSGYERGCNYNENKYIESPYKYSFKGINDEDLYKTYFTLEQWINSGEQARLINKTEVDQFYETKRLMKSR